MSRSDLPSVSRREFAALLAASAASVVVARGAQAAMPASNGLDADDAAANAVARRAGKGRARPRPTPAQLQWQRDEFALFLHFGVNTFTDREWGTGAEEPAIFNPTALDAAQWVRAAKEAGARTVILTAKHHDGFCLWPTKTTTHSVASSPWRGGKGDVVRELADAARAAGLRLGLYCSPWDRNSPVYGDSVRYNDLYIAQLTELLTQYGPVAEVWFDGANGEGPNGKKQTYDWPRIWGTVRRLQPNAVMFSDAGPDVRWIGNETGSAGDPNWSTVNPAIVTAPGVDGPEIIRSLQHGDRDGSVWRPGETDVSIRPGWFYHATEDEKVKSVEKLMDIWFSSVGRNSKLLLNVPPNREGLLSAADVTRLREFRAARERLFGREVQGQSRPWLAGPDRTMERVIRFDAPVRLAAIRLEENIEGGQQVARYSIEADVLDATTRPLVSGETVGYCKLHRLTDTTPIRQVRIVLEAFAESPVVVAVRCFAAES